MRQMVPYDFRIKFLSSLVPESTERIENQRKHDTDNNRGVQGKSTIKKEWLISVFRK